MAPKRLTIVVSGRVQGVWFRASTREVALRELLAWRQTGPPRARVDRVDPCWGTATCEYQEFSIRA